MGRFKNFFVEEVQEEVPVMEMDYEYDEVDVNVEEVSQESLIEDIYTSNNLSDLSRSIFKVEELINSLPKEMPNETKKATVLSILSSFNLTAEEVAQDGYSRETIIRSALDEIVKDNETVISDNNIAIEQKKKEIQELEKDNANRETVIKDTEDKIELETKRIEDLINFIGGAV